MLGLDARSRINTAWMERQVLDHVKQALRVMLQWNVPPVGIPRKLSSVQFTLKSFQRHLERLMNIEEEDGYMVLVAETKPNMVVQIERLEHDHSEFRDTIESLLPEVDSLSECRTEEFDEVCQQIACLLNRVDQHDAAEVELLQDALLCDEGGEG